MAATLLCIDDDPKALSGLREAFGGEATWIQCRDLEEAFEIVVVEEPDLVLLEVQLQGGNGLDFVERLRRSGGEAAGTPVLVVTRAGRTPGVYGRAMQLGVAGYFSKPAPTRQLLDAAREQIRKGEAARAAGSSWDGELGIGAGRLADLPLAELLDRVHRRAESGVLIVGDSRDRTGMQVRNGSPVAVTLPSDEGIDDFLIRTGRLSEADRDAALGQAPLGLASVEGVLLDAGLIDEDALDQALRDQADEAIFQLFALPKGRYRFEPGRRLKGARSLDVTRSAQSFIVRGVLAWTPVERVRDSLARYAELYASASAHPDPAPDDVPFSDAQRRFVQGLAGDRTVADFLDGSEFELRTLYAFALLGSVGLTPEPMLVLDDALMAEPRASAAPEPEEELVLELDHALEDPPDLSHEDTLFQGVVPPPVLPAVAPDLSYEEELFEQRVFEEDSFENEMVAESDPAGDSLLDIEQLVGPEPDFAPAPTPEPEPEPEVEVPRAESLPAADAPANGKKKTRKRKLKRRKRSAEPEPEPRAATEAPEPPARVEPAPQPAPVRVEVSEPAPAPLARVQSEPARPPEPVVAEEPVQPEPAEEEPGEVEVPATPEPTAEPLAAAQAPSSSPATAPDVSDRVAARGTSAPRSSSGGYEIAPLGSIQTDPAERALIARRVQKRLDQRYAQLVERHKPQTAPASPGEASAGRALEAERWFRKGSEFLKVKKYDEAVEAFGMSAHHDPSEGEYVAHLGYALYLSRPDNELVRKEALEDIARGIKLSPDRELPYVYLGRIFKVQGKIDDARKMFERALKIRPHCRLASQEIRLMDMRDKKKNAGLLSRFLK